MLNDVTKFFLIARKSTDVEDKQVMSIDAQLNELREFADREHVSILAELVEKQSAKSPGRPVFDAMLERIEAGEAQGILAWHPDRLARNSIDGGRIIYLLDTGKIKALKFPTFRFEPDPQGKFMLSIMFGQSKYYVDSLSENVKRGIREKVRRGEFPHVAPIGYLNDYRTKTIIVDKERATIVKDALERYATGTETIDSIRSFLKSRGVKSSTGNAVSRTFVSRLLANPIYYGHFRYNGEVHEGKHPAIITKNLFDEVQTVLDGRWRFSTAVRAPQPKAFSGLLRCASCGMAITAEVQKGHTYYRCTKKSRLQKCAQPFIREEALDVEISALLKPFALKADWADQMLELVKKEKKQSAQSAVKLAAQKQAEIEKVNQRLQRLLDTFLDGLIDREAFTVEKSRLMSQRKTLEEQKAACQTGQNGWLEPLQKWILTAKNAGEIALSQALPEKRLLALEIFGSNLVLDSKKARGYCVKPWSLIPENRSLVEVVGWQGLEPWTNALKGHCSTN